MLTGEDGSAFAVSGLDSAIMPAGRYALGSVALSVQLTSANQPIHFVFSRVGVDADTRWHELKKDQELILDPVGKLRFGLEIEKRPANSQTGSRQSECNHNCSRRTACSSIRARSVTPRMSQATATTSSAR